MDSIKKTLLDLSIPYRSALSLQKLGENLSVARRRRRISTTLMAKRADISRTTLNKIEKGSPDVQMGNYLKVLYVLGMHERLTEVFEPGMDEIGLILEESNIPKRIRTRKRK